MHNLFTTCAEKSNATNDDITKFVDLDFSNTEDYEPIKVTIIV